MDVPKVPAFCEGMCVKKIVAFIRKNSGGQPRRRGSTSPSTSFCSSCNVLLGAEGWRAVAAIGRTSSTTWRWRKLFKLLNSGHLSTTEITRVCHAKYLLHYCTVSMRMAWFACCLVRFECAACSGECIAWFCLKSLECKLPKGRRVWKMGIPPSPLVC